MEKITTASSVLTLAALFAAAVASSCSSDSLSEDGNANGGEGRTVTLTAKVNESDVTTRVGMTKNGTDYVDFYWHSSDAILVQTVNEGGSYPCAMFSTSTETGETSAEFTGVIGSGSTLGSYAVYPNNVNHKFTSEKGLTYNLPSTYDYSTVESGIFTKTGGTPTYRSTSTNIPMVGKITGDAIEFKHIGGLAVIRIEKMPAASGTLTVTADQKLCGNFNIGDLAADVIAIATPTTAATDGTNKVTFSFRGATTGKAGVFYLPLATGSYSSLKIAISDGTTMQTVNYGDLTIARGDVVAIPITSDSKGNLRNIESLGNNKYKINGHTFVDLGLSVLWAEDNVGASSTDPYGNYYAWGEVTAYKEATDWGTKSVKTSYIAANYKFGSDAYSLTKYSTSDGKTTLEAEDDAATVNWGSGCRMPTATEIDELLTNCTWTITGDITSSGGINGETVTGKKSGYTGCSIFLPSVGCCDPSLTARGDFYGEYWSSTRPTTSGEEMYAYILYVRSNNAGDQLKGLRVRNYGHAVRPVAEKP